MKYMIMLYGSQQDYDAMAGKPGRGPAMTPEQVAAMHAHMQSVHEELAKSGELVGGNGLTAPVFTRRVQLRDGAPVVTDGPYPEAQEVLAGFTIVDCESFDRATQIAARFVTPEDSETGEMLRAAFGDGEYVDVRPIAENVDELTV